MYNTKNALAELAVRLGTDVLSLGRDKYPEIEKASRIIAELANADFWLTRMTQCRTTALNCGLTRSKSAERSRRKEQETASENEIGVG